MGSLHGSAASLGFYGDDLDPSEITALLGGQPTVAVRKGGVWLTSRGVEKIARTGSWRLETERHEPADLNGQIDRLLGGLTDDMSIWHDLAARYRAEIFCGLFMASFNEGIALKPEVLARIGQRGLLLDLDIYGHEPSD